MTVVVGYIPHRGGRGALDLGLQARPRPRRGDGGRHGGPPAVARRRRMAKIDAEYAEYARQVGEEAEQQARDYLTRHERRGRDLLPHGHGAVGVVRARRRRAASWTAARW